MCSDRTCLYEAIERTRNSKVLVYFTGDRRGLEAYMSSGVLDFFVDHLDRIGVVKQISLVLYTRGGETLSAWSLANLLRMFCDRLEIIVPAKCHSAGTLLCLGADNLVMTKQATLGPIDPSVNTPLNPQLPGGQPMANVAVNVEDLTAFIEQAREALGNESIAPVFERLVQSVHPLVIGKAYRTRSQIRMLGERLLSNHMQNQETRDKALDFLCSESGSHDYTINRREARESLCLPVETPSQQFYDLISRLYNDIANELELTTPYDANFILGSKDEANYTFRRALIESLAGGRHTLVSEGVLTRRASEIRPGVTDYTIDDQRRFEGWRGP